VRKALSTKLFSVLRAHTNASPVETLRRAFLLRRNLPPPRFEPAAIPLFVKEWPAMRFFLSIFAVMPFLPAVPDLAFCSFGHVSSSHVFFSRHSGPYDSRIIFFLPAAIFSFLFPWSMALCLPQLCTENLALSPMLPMMIQPAVFVSTNFFPFLLLLFASPPSVWFLLASSVLNTSS